MGRFNSRADILRARITNELSVVPIMWWIVPSVRRVVPAAARRSAGEPGRPVRRRTLADRGNDASSEAPCSRALVALLSTAHRCRPGREGKVVYYHPTRVATRVYDVTVFPQGRPVEGPRPRTGPARYGNSHPGFVGDQVLALAWCSGAWARSWEIGPRPPRSSACRPRQETWTWQWGLADARREETSRPQGVSRGTGGVPSGWIGCLDRSGKPGTPRSRAREEEPGTGPADKVLKSFTPGK